MPWEKGKEGASAIGELGEAWLQAVGWIHAMTDAERLELARRTAYMHVIASAAAGAAGCSVPLQAVPPDEAARSLLRSAFVMLERVRIGQAPGSALGELIVRIGEALNR